MHLVHIHISTRYLKTKKHKTKLLKTVNKQMYFIDNKKKDILFTQTSQFTATSSLHHKKTLTTDHHIKTLNDHNLRPQIYDEDLLFHQWVITTYKSC